MIESMDPLFAPYIESLHSKLQELIAAAPITPLNVPRSTCKKGVYLLSEGDQDHYVGRSNHIRKRLSRHCSPGATHRMAAFAFRLAREKTGNIKATYKKGHGSRSALMEDPTFLAAFEEAKDRIAKMSVRYVEETDPIKQALLEIYVAVVRRTRYNDFDNH
ncbi:MAG: GIY-YIG nuclease family protein [Acidobacteriia bacterium]|nr:GIY-YIG nuclease family protein [Terriglobia bacterium]